MKEDASHLPGVIGCMTTGQISYYWITVGAGSMAGPDDMVTDFLDIGTLTVR